MADDVLSLEVVVLDRFSVPIQNMQRQLRLLFENNAKGHTQGAALSLRIKLASGLVPDGGVRTKGSLFREIRMDKAPLPLASTTG